MNQLVNNVKYILMLKDKYENHKTQMVSMSPPCQSVSTCVPPSTIIERVK